MALSPAEYPAKVPPARRAVLIDVIRATTSIVVAFQRGCAGVIPVRTPEEARVARARLGDEPALLCGEQGGLRIPGFDLGNSPHELLGAHLAGRRLILCTSNGTRALASLAGVVELWIGALRNAAAVARALAGGGGDALLACAGKDETFCLEDAACAGAIVHALRAGGRPVEPSDAAAAAEVLFLHYRGDLLSMLRGADWGRRIEGMGLLEDIRLCAELDAAPVAPRVRAGCITV
ncbi:MAG TPA: 2-phosphosulfolactate phosphatase [Candidatus Methylomirabilis sp.]